MEDERDFKFRAAAKTIKAIADNPHSVTLDSRVPGALDLGRDCSVAVGLTHGLDSKDDVSDSPVVRHAFASLDLDLPSSGLLGDCCRALITELHKRQ